MKDALIEPLTIIVNQIRSTGIFPDRLKIVKIIPLFKNEEITLLANYRPIFLLSTFSKIIERIIFYQFYEYFHNKYFFYIKVNMASENDTEFAALVDKLTYKIDNYRIPRPV